MSSERLNFYNYLNVVAFALSWVLNSDVVRGPEAQDQNMFWSGIGNLFNRYESIVNPTSQTYLIAHLILLLEGVFTCVQLLPKYRASVMVQDSVKHWFFLSALMQFLWSVDLGLANTVGQVLSVLFMGGMFFSVTRILLLQAANTDSTQTPEEYWLLRFPFSMHFAWAMAVFSMSLNGFFVQLEVGRTAQVVMGIITLLSFIAVAYKMIFRNGSKPNYVVPLVLAWFCIGISVCEQGPKVHLEGTQKLIFNGFAGFTAFALALVTAVVFVRTEILAKRQEDGSTISNDMKDVNYAEDTVYVSAPDNDGGAMA
mmetsp:Transcript_5210/g.9921  ORF Transcript_5210/g.9921 Transcript_5210/m.9921 type:complete len:312 (+) Transcript_5210:470-1405(+)|eukprot:CAMPEP_0176488192 /NCGR_PEP_ID=MMETSP0200_2-20121128/6572_1 /TAXON_ID=947934 /ORGANISM="Chaetoceros sp., Strain GSL56" /LENGTH=311 /DNA_ID=CAMNT_0017885147 /DNA_START=326 /DNA_END=1261 /DNA_ORIENTATION=-